MVTADQIEMAVFLLGVLVLVLTGAVALLAIQLRRVARLRHRSRADGGEWGPTVMQGLSEAERRLEQLSRQVSELQVASREAVRHVGVVRYDAFRDMGGHMSFSLALLNGRQDGVVLSVLNGRDGSRGYAKAVRSGKAAAPLSEEEQQAIAAARGLSSTQ